MQHLRLTLSLCVLAVWALFGCQPAEDSSQQYDMVIKNGTIYTMDSQMPKAEAVGVKGGKIAFVGSAAEAEKGISETTKVIDLQGKTMTPGFIESHAHIMGIGYNRIQVDLLSTKSYQEVIDKVAEAVANAQPGDWIVGRGWHQDKWDSIPGKVVKGFQTHHALSEVSPNNPVYLKHASGHAALANAKAMEIAGVQLINPENIEQAEVEGGEIIRDETGNPTGIFNEMAQGLISKHIPESNMESHERALAAAIQECLENGITSFHDAGADSLAIATFEKFIQEEKMRFRLYVMLSSRDSLFLERWFEKGPQIGMGDGRLTIRSIKLYADGALGSRGAWLLEPYSDLPGHTGHETTPMPYMEWVTEKGLANGFQVCSHAIGDRANREILDMYEAAFKANPSAATDHRFRIEHAQHLDAEDIPRFAELDVIASMQAIHMSSDRPWAIDRLGEERIKEGAYVWKKLLESGARIINGTDAPVEPVSAIASFYASVTRQTLEGTPEGGYEPDQKMTREEALRTYTLYAAYGAFEEDTKGSIEVGKYADFTVFSQDLMTVPDNQILDTQVDYTIVGGKVEYQRGE